MRRDLHEFRVLAVLIPLLLGTGACTPVDDLMVAVFGRSMRDSRAFDPYENPHPPDTTAVPFAAGNYPAQLGDVNVGQPEMGVFGPDIEAAEMAAPGSERVRSLENPVPAGATSLERGAELYDRYCTVCHGPAGVSTEAPIFDKLPQMGAYVLATGAAVSYTDGYIYGMITKGRGIMPAYGPRIPYFDRWHVVNYVRQLQRDAGSTPVIDTVGAAGGAPGAGNGGGG